MPVGTRATVKGLTPRDLRACEAECILANTYHLALQPGADAVAGLGGLHAFMGWNGPILTDSGGFQVFSLAGLRRTTDEGVSFRSHLDGKELELTPERVIELEEQLGADIIMPLDVCLAAGASRAEAERALDRTARWARRAQAAQRSDDQQLFGIVQGQLFPDLRRQAARDLRSLDFSGYAIGGLSIGEALEATGELVELTTAELPVDRPRYLMGVGTPEQLLAYIALGVDMFDCVLPTRLGRTGLAFTRGGRLNVRRAELRDDPSPVDESCDCLVCARFSRGFLHAAFRERWPLAGRLLSLHNVRTLVRLARRAHAAVLDGTFAKLLIDSGAWFGAGSATGPASASAEALA